MKKTLTGSMLTLALYLSVAPVVANADELRVVFRDQELVHKIMDMARDKFAAKHPDVEVVFEAITASPADYYTKIALMNQSAQSAPDVVYLDGFYVTSDAAAGYLEPLDDLLAKWEDWSQFSPAARRNGTSFIDGKVYALPIATDTQGIYFSKDLFAEAGLPTDWQPKTWQDMLDAAAAIKAKLPDVTPLNIFVTKAQNEAATLRGMLNLISGAPGGLDATLYDPKTEKWIVGSTGMKDALTFLKTAYESGYLPADSDLQDPNLQNVLTEQRLLEGKIAFFIDGSWNWTRWDEKGDKMWLDWADHMGLAKIPTQNGQDPGFTSMSGGWVVGMTPHAEDKQVAFDFVSEVVSRDAIMEFATLDGAIPLRDDVINDPAYNEAVPSSEFFGSVVQYTNFRPTLEIYPRVSSLIQETMESVSVGGASVEEAQQRYDSQLTRLAGSANVAQGQ